MLEEAGFEVDTNKIPQDELADKLPGYAGIMVRSATKVRQDLMDKCPDLKVIGRGGVGLDNIDVDYAKERGIAVFNTPAASSQSVAELVFAHALGIARFMQNANRDMPAKGNSAFKDLKKSYSKGVELRGKTIGIIGFGRIGQHVGRIAAGVGMRVIAHDPFIEEATLEVDFPQSDQVVKIAIQTTSIDEVLKNSDVITLHVPSQGRPLIGAEELAKMKNNAILINASRGGIIDEDALVNALNEGEIAGAGLDVFDNEPTPSDQILNHPKISLTPHTGASTEQAQANIGTELAGKFIAYLNGA